MRLFDKIRRSGWGVDNHDEQSDGVASSVMRSIETKEKGNRKGGRLRVARLPEEGIHHRDLTLPYPTYLTLGKCKFRLSHQP